MNEDRTALAFAALADATRRRIVELLADGRQVRVADLAGEFSISRQALTKHLDVLAEAGLTTTVRKGRERLTGLDAGAFAPLRRWLEHYGRFWDEKLAGLQALLEEEDRA